MSSASSWKNRLRATAIGLMTLVGLISIVATSPPSAQIEDVATGPPVSLDSDRRSATASFDVTASSPTLSSGLISVWVTFEPFWTGVDQADRRLRTALRKTGSTELILNNQDLSCLGDECTGPFEMEFELPRVVDVGSVRIEWSVHASASFSDTNEPPEGATISASTRPMDRRADVPIRLYKETAWVSNDHPIALHRIRIRSAVGIPSDDLFLEVGPTYEDVPTPSPAAAERLTILLIAPGTKPVEIGPSSSIVLELPAECVRGPCDYSISVLVQLDPPVELGDDLGVDLAIVGREPELVVDVLERTDFPVEWRILDLGRVHLENDSTAVSCDVEVRLTRSRLQDSALNGLEPLAGIRLILGADPDTLQLPEPSGVLIQVIPAPGERPIEAFRFPQSDIDDPVVVHVPMTCEALACHTTVTIRFSLMQVPPDDDASIVMRPLVGVTVPYPSGEIPEDIQLDVLAIRDEAS